MPDMVVLSCCECVLSRGGLPMGFFSASYCVTSQVNVLVRSLTRKKYDRSVFAATKEETRDWRRATGNDKNERSLSMNEKRETS